MNSEEQAEAQQKAADEWALVRQMSIYKVLLSQSEDRMDAASAELLKESITVERWRTIQEREQDIQNWFAAMEQLCDNLAAGEEYYGD